jgi:hypothetical protein
MPPRLNKRQQRELEELEALGGSPKPAGSESADDETPAVKNKGMFAAASVRQQYSLLSLLPSPAYQLFAPEADDDDSDNTEPEKKSKKPKKKKKKSAGTKAQNDSELKTPVSAPIHPPPPTASSDLKPEEKEVLTASERKALKKAKQKEKKAKVDDLDRALAELAIKCVAAMSHSFSTPNDCIDFHLS